MCETKCDHKYKDASVVFVEPKHLFIVSSVCQACYYTEYFIFHESDVHTYDEALKKVLNNKNLIPDIIGYTTY